MTLNFSFKFLLIIVFVEVITAFKFDFIENFQSKITPGFVDSNTGYYKILNQYELKFNLSEIFGENNFNISKYTIVSILKFKYTNEDYLGINVFDLIVSGYDENRWEINFYIRRDNNKISIANSKDFQSTFGHYDVPKETILADDRWHKIIIEFDKGIFQFWVDCQHMIETKPDKNAYEFLGFPENRTLKIELSPKRLFYRSADFELKSLQLVTGADIEEIKKNDCSDVPSSNRKFKLNALNILKVDSKFYDKENDLFEFKNYKELKEELQKFYPNYLQYNFDSRNFVVDFDIQFPQTDEVEKDNKILDGRWHKLAYTANEKGEIRVYVDCIFIGNYTLYNIKKNLNFIRSTSVVDTIFELGLQDAMFKLKSLNINSEETTEENLKSICPEHKGLETDTLLKCSELKKPFEDLNCEGKIFENWKFNGIETIKTTNNKINTPEGDVFNYDGLTKFSGDLAEDNPNLFAPNFNSKDFSSVYILKIKNFNGENQEETIYDGNWHKMSIFRAGNFFDIYSDCNVVFRFNVIENAGYMNFDHNLNFINVDESVSIIPFYGRFDGFDIYILNFTVYSPAKQINPEDCADIIKLNKKN
ncbi:uncharacterized protein LOC129613255 [Condylostylus longicornis]|uniref:uncharacterized protein LOC129613255 n=1 Tax=Condylostylus longicornis TaxID=2530218 RepID=UPI00244DCE0A|nr:uncharacterized protein LOC129613255 [Condylostylus longicornis]